MNPGQDNYQAARDGNRVTVATGQSNIDVNQTLPFLMDHVTGRLLVDDSGGGGGTQVLNEVVSGSGTSWTLAHTPNSAGVALYANGQRLTPGGVDYTLTGANIVTVLSWSSGSVLADYQY